MDTEMSVFVRVVDAGSFSAAASHLGLPKSTVSRKVSRLEDRLGAALLRRTTRSLHLTDVGRAYYERAARIVSDIEEAEQAVTSMHARPQGPLRITAPFTFGYLYLGRLVAEYGARFPAVELHVQLTDRVVSLVDEGFDVAIRAGFLRDSSLIARKLGQVGTVVCASPTYLAARGRPQVPEDLEQHDCLVNANLPGRNRWELSPGRAVTVRARLSCNNWDVLRDAALAGLGLTCLPALYAGAALEDGRLEQVLPEHTASMGALYAVYPASRHLSAKVRTFVDFLAEQLSERPPWTRLQPVGS